MPGCPKDPLAQSQPLVFLERLNAHYYREGKTTIHADGTDDGIVLKWYLLLGLISAPICIHEDKRET